MRIWWLAAALIFSGNCCPPPAKPIVAAVPVQAAPPPSPEPSGFEPPPPTLRLPRHFTPTRYTARLAIDPATPAFDGEIAIDGTLDQRSAVIWLNGKHLDVQAASATDGSAKVAVAVTPKGDFLELRPAHPLEAGHWTLTLTYRGAIEQTGYSGAFRSDQGADPYVFSQFESTAARLVFPCIDEPDRKTPWQLTLDVPKGLVALSNTAPTATTELDAGHERVVFAPTRPLPSYLVAFAVGAFEIVDAGKAKSGVALRVATPRGTKKEVAFLASAMPRLVDILEAWFAIPYPYPKLDIVVVPSSRGNFMENAGMITADARGVLFDSPSARQRYQMVSIIGHETAHQWFGDLVTAAWWDDIWVNESFATWIEDKILTTFDPTWPTQAESHRRDAFASDSIASARKIRQPIESEGDIHNAFDGITYPKGALVLRMIEHDIGEAAFQNAIRHYLGAHADANATATDVFGALEAAAGKKLAAITSSFFEQPGIPEVSMTMTCDAGKAKIALAQHRFTATDADKLPEEQWTLPVCIAYEGAKHERAETCTLLDEPRREIALEHCPAWFAPAGAYGYDRTRLDAKTLETIRDKAWPNLTPDERVTIYDDLAAQAVAGRQSLPLLVSFAGKLRAGKTSMEIAAAFGDYSTLATTYFPPNTGLPRGLDRAIPVSLRPAARAYVRAFAEPIVRKLGLVAHGEEDFATEVIHTVALGAALWSRSHALDEEAKRLVVHYRDLSSAARPFVLKIAANADPKIAAQLRAEVLDEHDAELRALLLSVVGDLEDPKRHRAMLESLVPEPKMTPLDIVQLLIAGDQAVRLDSEAYLRAHLDEVVKRMPAAENDDFPMVLNLLDVFTSTCDPGRRDEIADYVTNHFTGVASAARPLKQAIERMDQCIDQKKLLEPSLRVWLGGKTR